ncbi:MAG: GAF domain-containing protein [Clostridia bacterium]|nr:GAF domain-containing protein [Clostridia bacterium]
MLKEISELTFKDKKQMYNFMKMRLTALIGEESDWLANLSNASALMWQILDDINWSGFYLMKNGKLVLGPFQGKPACVNIEVGKGVCGTAASTKVYQLVKDVHDFPGHIACDSASNSEVVIPIIIDGTVVGVLDIDSPSLNRFDHEDVEGLTKFVDILIKYIDFESALNR